MAMRIFEVRNMETGETVMVLQGKQVRTMEKAVTEYIRLGRLPYAAYEVRPVQTER